MTSQPASALGWLDYREDDARRVRELLRAFEEKGTLDSIGIGTVRDAVADVLFPGLSTLHTRARYFFFIPWIYQGLEQDVRVGRVGATRLSAAAREREVGLMDALQAGGEEQLGIIGARARAKVRTLPRDIYWGGLRRFGMLVFQGPSRSYLEAVAQGRRSRSSITRSDDGEAVAGALGAYWRPGIPSAPYGLTESTTFDLTGQEAAYLLERIVDAAPGTLLAELAQRRPALEDVNQPWQVPVLGDLPAGVRDATQHAECFSTVIYGAQVLYNELLLARMHDDTGGGPNEGLDAVADAVADQRAAWLSMMDDDQRKIGAWDRNDFWHLVLTENPRIPSPTRSFVNGWVDAARTDPEGALADPHMHRAVVDREARLKGGLARLTNQRAREQAEPPYGMEPLNYRWLGVARQLITDISAGMEAGGAHA